MFRQIGQIALDGVSLDLQRKIERAVEGSVCEALTLRSAAGISGDRPLGGDQSVAFAQAGGGAAAQTELKKSEAVAPAVAVVGHRFLPTIGRDMATARRAEPHGSAVVISLAIWKRHHAKPPIMARTSSEAMTSRKPAKK